MSQSVKALPQTPQASQNWSLMQVLLEKKRNIILPLICWSYLNFTSEGLPGEIYVVCCFVFVFVFLLLNRRVKKLKNTRQKKKQQKAHYHALIEFPSTQGGVSVQLVITSLSMQIKKKVILCRCAGKDRIPQDTPFCMRRHCFKIGRAANYGHIYSLNMKHPSIQRFAQKIFS